MEKIKDEKVLKYVKKSVREFISEAYKSYDGYEIVMKEDSPMLFDGERYSTIAQNIKELKDDINTLQAK